MGGGGGINDGLLIGDGSMGSVEGSCPPLATVPFFVVGVVGVVGVPFFVAGRRGDCAAIARRRRRGGGYGRMGVR